MSPFPPKPHKATTSGALQGPPPTVCTKNSSNEDGKKDQATCLPVLILGNSCLPAAVPQLLQNDLVYATTSQLSSNEHWSKIPQSCQLKMLDMLDGETLVKMTAAFGGSVCIDDEGIYEQPVDGSDAQINMAVLEKCKNATYQAVIVPDYLILDENAILEFVKTMYNTNRVSAVIVHGAEGIFDLSALNAFSLDWRLIAYTSRNFGMTEAGTKILSSYAFPFQKQYSKANIVHGRVGVELFREVIDPKDYEADDDADGEPDPIPDPQPGSPVMTLIDRNGTGRLRSISYFGFVNSLDVSWGAIMLRLAYAHDHYHTAN